MEAEGTVRACFDESMGGKSYSHQESSRSNRSDDSAVADARPSANACFDCSICLDFAVNPVVTLCGHLYCWPCIYKWLQVETTAPQHCPVCKSPLSLNALVPLYGRGNSNLPTKTKGLGIPNRPAVLGDKIASVIGEQHSSALHRRVHQQRQQQAIHHHHSYCPSPWGGMGVFGSTAGGVLGGLGLAILPLVARNNQGVGEMHLSRSNHLMLNGSSASRRRQERRVEDSLHQIWVFLFCCAVLGLLLF